MEAVDCVPQSIHVYGKGAAVRTPAAATCEYACSDNMEAVDCVPQSIHVYGKGLRLGHPQRQRVSMPAAEH
jgi:hypothetical protein